MASVTLPQVKDVFAVNKRCNVGQEGYLAAASGELVEVLYVGEKHDELGWVYCKILPGCEGRSDICRKGRIFRNLLDNNPEPHPEPLPEGPVPPSTFAGESPTSAIEATTSRQCFADLN